MCWLSIGAGTLHNIIPAHQRGTERRCWPQASERPYRGGSGVWWQCQSVRDLSSLSLWDRADAGLGWRDLKGNDEAHKKNKNQMAERGRSAAQINKQGRQWVLFTWQKLLGLSCCWSLYLCHLYSFPDWTIIALSSIHCVGSFQLFFLIFWQKWLFRETDRVSIAIQIWRFILIWKYIFVFHVWLCLTLNSYDWLGSLVGLLSMKQEDLTCKLCGLTDTGLTGCLDVHLSTSSHAATSILVPHVTVIFSIIGPRYTKTQELMKNLNVKKIYLRYH